MQTRPSSNTGPTALAEINVTPLVDVMLVLLIVFMISAPLMQHGVQVDLPKADATSLDDSQEEILLVISPSRKIMINGKVLAKGTLRERLGAIASAKPNAQVFIQADRTISYGFVARVIAEVRQAGVGRVGLVTQPDSSGYRP